MLYPLQEAKHDTRQKIISGALDVLRNYGLKYDTIDMIATHLAMPKKIIYKNFSNKKALVNYAITQYIDDTKNKLEAILKTINDAVGQMFVSRQVIMDLVETVNVKIMRQLKKYFPESFNAVREFNNDYLFHYFKENLKKGVTQGVYSKRIDAEIISAYIVENFIFPLSSGAFTKRVFRKKEKDRQIMLYHLFGIITEEGNRSVWQYIGKVPEIPI